MPTISPAPQRRGKSQKFPIVCKTWKEVEAAKKKYLKPVRFGPKNQPIYDHDEVAKLIVAPTERE